MNSLEDVLTLVKAGFTAEQILAFSKSNTENTSNDTPTIEKTIATEPHVEKVETDSPVEKTDTVPPVIPPVTETVDTNKDTINKLIMAVDNLTKVVQAKNIVNSNIPIVPVDSAEDALASIFINK